jgi:hypothetical protein
VSGQPADDAPSAGLVAFALLWAVSFVALLLPSTRRWVKRPS